jgi:Domain of unknown function (DUF4919)
VGQPVVGQPVVGQPVVGQPVVGQPAGGRYEQLVAKAEAGEAVDLRELRMAYLDSSANPGPDTEALRKTMFQGMRNGDFAGVFETSQQLLSRRYIDLHAHKARRQSCEALGRADCAKYKSISLGLLRSVVAGRDGKTCATGWEVVHIDEEYFVAAMLDMTVEGQRLVSGVHLCDALQVVNDQNEHSTLYFDIGVMMEASPTARANRATQSAP